MLNSIMLMTDSYKSEIINIFLRHESYLFVSGGEERRRISGDYVFRFAVFVEEVFCRASG